MDGVYTQSGGHEGPVFIDWRIIHIEAKAEKVSFYSHHGALLDDKELNFNENERLIISDSVQISKKEEGVIALCLRPEKSDEMEINYTKIQKTNSAYNSEELKEFPIQFLDIGGVKFYKKSFSSRNVIILCPVTKISDNHFEYFNVTTSKNESLKF